MAESDDLVTEVFTRLREVAKKNGPLPNLMAPPRKHTTDMLSGRGPAELADVVVPGMGRVADFQRTSEFDSVPRDAAGTRIPDRLRNTPGIRYGTHGRRRPQPLGSVLAKQIIDRGWNPQLARGVVLTQWESIVGPELAAQVTIDSFDEGTLRLRASSTAWATQLRLMQEAIIAKIAHSVGDGVVTQLKIVGPPQPNWRKGKYYVKGRGPRDTYG
ncbi:DUF721 domain-containing protein [Corynebacterium sp. TAE3-ERU12]|uniref:DUF721 domain-containing protein n=1 Tax=Corynebacterium sp. TAE3-ERU12 TaxID=2849491 RepID=UPI001C4879B9|nr:DciA family protein [Corynebacterium sp. TAE3-ERU12]MBV7294348.1 DUF721 domain-containing protein [Corynebacterium sp. TAE3-ERU12]